MKRRKVVLSIVLAAVLVIAAGCQAVGGLDLNGVLKTALKVQSMEGKQTIGFQLLLKPDALKDMEPEEAAVVTLLSKVKLELSDIKMKDGNTASYNGALALGDTRIGFNLRTAGNLTVLKVDGIAKPIELDLTANSLNGLLGSSGMLGQSVIGSQQPAGTTEDMQAEIKALADKLVDVVGGYAIDNLPNPTRLTVAPVTEQVGNESVSLMKVHADINGKELWTWAGSYLDALIADKDGLKAMLTGFIDVLSQHQTLWDSLGSDNPFADLPQGAERDKEIEQGVEVIIDSLTQLQTEYRNADQAEVNAILNDNTYIKADVYADAKLNIRRMNAEFALKPAAASDASAGSILSGDPLSQAAMAADVVEGLVLTLDSESWNVNGTVTPDAPVKTQGAITLEQLESMQGYNFLREVDKQSPLYDLLRNKLHIAKQEISLHPSFDDYPPIVTPDGRTLVPLRRVAAQLGASVTLKPDKTIRLYDDGTFTGIDMRLGSSQVLVNGTKLKWSYPVTRLSNGVAYAPAKDLAAALRCKISWKPAYTGSPAKLFVIEREVD